jgi:hypothetical protein
MTSARKEMIAQALKYSSRRPSRVSLARKSPRVEIVDGIGLYVDWPEIRLQF